MAVPKNRPVGRPPKFRTPEEMQEKIDAYFRDCEGYPLLDENGIPITDKQGQVVIVGRRPMTMSGLALALGFMDRQSLLNYQGRGEFYGTIKRAKSRIEQYAEERLYDRDGNKGAAFALRCNHGWQEPEKRQEAVGSGENGVVELPAVLPAPTEVQP